MIFEVGGRSGVYVLTSPSNIIGMHPHTCTPNWCFGARSPSKLLTIFGSLAQSALLWPCMAKGHWYMCIYHSCSFTTSQTHWKKAGG